MLETNINNFSGENKAHVYFKTETKGDGTRKKLKDRAIRMISVQRKAMKGHAENLKEKLNYALKEANYANLDHKEEKNQVLNFQ